MAEQPDRSRVLDFDAYLAEQNQVPVILRFKGVDYDLGAELPAMVALEVVRQRALHGDNGDIPPEKLEELLRGVLGEHYDPIVVEGRLGLQAMGTMLVEVFQRFNPPANRGERRARAKGTRRTRSTSSRSGG